MALENYTEMRDTVLDAGFVRQKAIAMDLERRYPDRFIPRYSMVMFHPEIPYAEAQRRGKVQAEILAELDSKRDATGGTDAKLAERLVKRSWSQSRSNRDRSRPQPARFSRAKAAPFARVPKSTLDALAESARPRATFSQ